MKNNIIAINKRLYKRLKIAVLVAGVILLALGVGFLWQSMQTPIFTNEDAYIKTDQQINEDLASNKIDYDKASDRFYDNQDKNMSNKYALESAGWSFILASAYSGIAFGWLAFVSAKRKLPPTLWLYVLAVANAIIFMILSVVSIFVDFDRMLYPNWSDSIGIPLFSTILVSPLVIGITIGFVALITNKYTRTSSSLKFGTLSVPYKIYFILASLAGVALLIELIQSPDYVAIPLIAGSFLLNSFVYVGIVRRS